MRRLKSKWVRVTRRHPCPICGKPDWCMKTADGLVVLCMRTESDHPCRGECGGWIHKIGAVGGTVKPSTIYAKELEDEHMPGTSVGFLLEEWKRNTLSITLASFARDLGVTRASLERLGCVWNAGLCCWAFPMLDANGTPIGIRLRSKVRKYSITGSRSGLFFDPAAKPGRACAWLTEGPTDTAALMSIAPRSLVIGRSDLLSGWNMLKKALVRLKVNCLNICVDDEGELAGRTDDPGRAGSRRLAKYLGLPCKFVRTPGHKDIRDFVKSGGTMGELARFLSFQKYTRVEP